MSTWPFRIAREDPRTGDVAALIAELDAYMADLYPAESNHLLDLDALAAADIHVFIARGENGPEACGALWLREDTYGEAKRIYVRPRARGLGLARAILARIETTARRAGLSLLRLETGTRQPAARNLFAAAGFISCGPFADYPVDDPLSVFMEKRLAI